MWRNKRLMLSSMVAVTLPVAGGCYALYIRRLEQKEAEAIVLKIETFQRTHGQLPMTLEEIGGAPRKPERIFYQPEGNAGFSVWYGMSLGESRIYHSKTRVWSEEG